MWFCFYKGPLFIVCPNYLRSENGNSRYYARTAFSNMVYFARNSSPDKKVEIAPLVFSAT